MQSNKLRSHITLVSAALLLCSASPVFATDTTPLPPAALAPLPPIAPSPVVTPAAQLLELPGNKAKPAAAVPPAAIPAIPEKTLPAAAVPPLPVNAQPVIAPATPPAIPPVTPAAALPAAPLQNAMPMQALPVVPAPTANAAPADGKTAFSPKILTINGPPKVELLEAPVTIDDDFSLMFNAREMENIVRPSLSLFDKAGKVLVQTKKEDAAGNIGGDDLTGLLESLNKSHSDTKPVMKPLPNLYLGSIVYYSPSNWSVWVNGKKIVARFNNETNVLYVSGIASNEVTLVWKPSQFGAISKVWNEKAGSPATLPKNIVVDEGKNKVTLTLHPNETFVTGALVIREGLITKTVDVPLVDASAQPATAIQPEPAPGNAQPMPMTKNNFKPH